MTYNYDPLTQAYVAGRMAKLKDIGSRASLALRNHDGYPMASYIADKKKEESTLHIYINL